MPQPYTDLQQLCETGQQQLVTMDYLAAEATFERAEQLAIELSDWTTLARLYMPLQEARRQIRQRCGEGAINLRLLVSGPDDPAVDPERLIEQFPQGQLLIAGWGSIESAVRFRKLARQRRRCVETFLAAVYPTNEGAPRLVVIVPLESIRLPDVRPATVASMQFPPQSIVMSESELLPPTVRGTAETYAHTMAIWERLHAPFLAAANDGPPSNQMASLRQTIQVDYACELAHQRLSTLYRERAGEAQAR